METKIATSNKVSALLSKRAKQNGIRKGVTIHSVEKRGRIKKFPITKEAIDRNAGFLGTKGKLLKALLAEKKKEKKL